MKVLSYNKLKKLLDFYYVNYRHKFSSKDPVWNLHQLKQEKDIELAGFIISCYTYGNIDLINRFIKNLLIYTGKELYDFIINFDTKKQRNKNYNLNYRFNTNEDIYLLFSNLSRVLRKWGTLKNLFLCKYDVLDISVLKSLIYFAEILRGKERSRSYLYLIPDVKKNSTCKRLNLFLRWMVRKDEIDTGIWGREVKTSALLIPVDSHVYKVSRLLGLVSRKSCDLKFCIELTEKLKAFDPVDPVKYDFALCHIGVDKIKNPRLCVNRGF